MAKTAVIILNYNNCSDTRACLESLLAINSAPIKVIVVDNGSTGAERKHLKETISEVAPDAFLVQSDENLGYARGFNLGLEHAYPDPEVDRVLLLNNDIMWTEDILPELIRRQDSLDDCAVIAPMLYKPGSLERDPNCARRMPTVGEMAKRNFLHYWWRARGINQAKAQPRLYMTEVLESDSVGKALHIELPCGACMLLHKELMQRVGGFDPETFLYYEENILTKKFEALGLRNYLCPDLGCIHVGAATTSALPSSLFVMQQSVYSAKHYLKHYVKASLPKRWLFGASAAFLLVSFRLQKKLTPNS